MSGKLIQQEMFERLLDVSRRLGDTRELEQILSVIIDAMRDLLHAERATVFEYDAANRELISTVAHGLAASAVALNDDDSAEAPREVRFPVDRGIAGVAATTQRIVNVKDAYADARFNPEVDRRTGFRTRSILSIPLVDLDDALIGVAQVLNKIDSSFDAADEAIAAALASQAAVAIKRARLLQDHIARKKMERDLELARTIQQATFPTTLPHLEGYEIAAFSEPADETGGDAYDIVPLALPGCGRDPGGPRRGATFLLADATGHGIGPALHATQIRAMLRMALRLDAPLIDIARHINAQLCDDMPGGHFITGWLGRLDAASHTLTSFSAGQAPLLRLIAARDKVESLDADTLPYGIAPDAADAQPVVIALEPGDAFIVMSDGFFEAANAGGEQFGSKRIKALIRASVDCGAADLVQRIRDAVDAHCDGAAAQDDRTAVVIRRVR